MFAGHDYVSNDDGPMQSGENWTVNYDGTIDPWSGRERCSLPLCQ